VRRGYRGRREQRGWVGLIVLVLALVIVGVLVKTVMQQYGLTGAGGLTASRGGRLPPAVSPASPDTAGSVPTPRDAIQRARALDSMMKSDAIERRIDDSLK
jgi:hypothetical protein